MALAYCACPPPPPSTPSSGKWGSDEVYPGVYVSSFMLPRKIDALEEMNIAAIVNCAYEFPCQFSSMPYLHLHLKDQTHQNIYDCLVVAAAFIERHRTPRSKTAFAASLPLEEKCKYKNVLIHCAAGSSRSGTIATAYYMIKNNSTLADALRAVTRRRPKILPNEGFLEQLKRFEELNAIGRMRITDLDPVADEPSGDSVNGAGGAEVPGLDGGQVEESCSEKHQEKELLAESAPCCSRCGGRIPRKRARDRVEDGATPFAGEEEEVDECDRSVIKFDDYLTPLSSADRRLYRLDAKFSVENDADFHFWESMKSQHERDES